MLTRIRNLVVAVGIAAMMTVGTTAHATVAPSAPAATGVGVGGRPCTLTTVERVDHVVPDGSMRASTAANAATVTWLKGPSGEIPVPGPAKGWSPLTATAAELAFFGLAPRPSGPAQLADWKAEWANYSGFSTATPSDCVSAPDGSGLPGVGAGGSATAAGTSATASFTDPPNCAVLTCFPFWAGLVATAGSSYTEAYARTVPQTEFNTCSPTDGHVAWVGLGAWGGSGKLLQNGLATAGDLPQGTVQAFYQAILPGGGSGYIVDSDAVGKIHIGDTVSMSTTYNQTAQTFSFSWHDQSTGKVYPRGPFPSIGGHPASAYYDGGYAEVIDERTLVGQLDKMRNFGVQRWDQARVYSNGSSSYIGIRAAPHHVGPTMTSVDKQHTLVSVTGDTTEAFHDTWDQCGKVEPPPGG
jgi:hypothetical protein